jgi:hypothetical protein
MQISIFAAQLFFDWFSLAYILLILICTGIGLWRGLGRMIPRLITIVVAAIAAFYLCKAVASWFENGTTWDTSLSSWIHDQVESKSPGSATMVTTSFMTSPEGEAEFRKSIKLPDFLWNPFWLALQSFMPTDGSSVSYSTVIADTLSHLCFIAGAFILVFLVIYLMGLTITLIVEHVRKKNGVTKPSWLSRGLGAGLGLVVAIVLIYCCSLGVNLLASAQAKGQNTGDIASYLHLTGDDANNYWSLAKWLATQSFLYEQIMNFLGYAPVIASSLGSASSALTSSGSAMVSSLSTSL